MPMGPLYPALYPALSGVTSPLHRHVRPITTNGALSPHGVPRSGVGLVCYD